MVTHFSLEFQRLEEFVLLTSIGVKYHGVFKIRFFPATCSGHLEWRKQHGKFMFYNKGILFPHVSKSNLKSLSTPPQKLQGTGF